MAKQLTTQEQELLRRAFVEGPEALVAAGIVGDAFVKFLNRPDVQQYLAMLDLEFQQQDAFRARQQFKLFRDLSVLAPVAVDTLENSLLGVTYARTPDGHIKFDDKNRPIVLTLPPDNTQVNVAQDILNRMGVSDKASRDRGGISIEMLFHRAEEAHVQIMYDPTLQNEEQRALARERVRTVIEQLKELLPGWHNGLMAGLGKPVKSKTVKKKKARKRKKKIKKKGPTRKALPPGKKKKSAKKKKTAKKKAVKKKVKRFVKKKKKPHG